MKLTSIDLFAGAGGLSCGLRSEGFHMLAAVEIDPISAKTYNLNHANTKIMVNDIRGVSGAQMIKDVGLARGDLDLLTGCPPCQAFSTLRTRKRVTRPSPDISEKLIFEVLRLTRSIRPRSLVIENVPGMTQNENFELFCKGLTKSGYKFSYKILNAANFGVPQRRKRLVLVALRDSNIPSDFFDFAPVVKTVRDVIGQLPPAGFSGDKLHDLPERRTPKMIARIKATPKDGGSRFDLSPDFQCQCHVNINGFHDVYGRMKWDDVSPTITSGCHNPSKGRFIHPEADRAITLREAALLQSFPLDYEFCLDRGKDHIAYQIGNAFPPAMIKPIAKKLTEYLSK